MAAVQKQGSGLRRDPGKRCSSDSLDSSSLLGIKGVTSGKQGRMFLSGIHMTSAPRQRFTETGAELRLAQLSKEHLNGNGGNSATLPLCRLSAQPCGVCRDRLAGQQDHLCRCGHFSRHSGSVWFPLVLCTQKMLTIPFHFVSPYPGGVSEGVYISKVICLQVFARNRAGESLGGRDFWVLTT